MGYVDILNSYLVIATTVAATDVRVPSVDVIDSSLPQSKPVLSGFLGTMI